MHAGFRVVNPRWFATPLQANLYAGLYVAWLASELGVRAMARRAAGAADREAHAAGDAGAPGAAGQAAGVAGDAGARGPAEDRSGDRGSRLVILLGVLLSLGVSYVARARAPAAWLLPAWCFWLGAALMLGGMALRVWAIHTLGRFFNTAVTIRSDHRLVTGGPYRLLRHPAYSGSLATLLGVPLCLGTGLGLLVLAVVIPAVFAYRMRVEERALLARFGAEYADFMRRRWRLVPFVY